MGNWMAARFLEKINGHSGPKKDYRKHTSTNQSLHGSKVVILEGIHRLKKNAQNINENWYGIRLEEAQRQTSGSWSDVFKYFSYHLSCLLTSLKHLVQWEMLMAADAWNEFSITLKLLCKTHHNHKFAIWEVRIIWVALKQLQCTEKCEFCHPVQYSSRDGTQRSIKKIERRSVTLGTQYNIDYSWLEVPLNMSTW